MPSEPPAPNVLVPTVPNEAAPAVVASPPPEPVPPKVDAPPTFVPPPVKTPDMTPPLAFVAAPPCDEPDGAPEPVPGPLDVPGVPSSIAPASPLPFTGGG